MRRLEIAGSVVFLFPSVRGLTSETERVRRAFDDVKPAAVALSISPEELEGMRRHDGSDVEPANPEEAVYMRELARFGDVRKPPPSFAEAARLCGERNVPCVAVDMDEERYTDAFTSRVGTIDLLLHSMRMKRVTRRAFDATSPEAFVLAFDEEMNRLEGYRRLEDEREEHIAEEVRRLAAKWSVVLTVLDFERTQGVARRLVTK